MAMPVGWLWRWARAQARKAMAPRPQHQKEWGWLRSLATNKDYYVYLYKKLRAGWPAPQPPRPIPPEIPEPPSPIIFVEPALVPDLAYGTPTTTPDDDPPASGKLLSVSALLGVAGFFLCLAVILHAKAKEGRTARRRMLYLQGGWRAVAAEGRMLPPPHIGA